jgi:hypothetical protein
VVAIKIDVVSISNYQPGKEQKIRILMVGTKLAVLQQLIKLMIPI